MTARIGADAISDGMSFGTAERIELSLEPVTTQDAQTSQSARPRSRMSRFFSGMVSSASGDAFVFRESRHDFPEPVARVTIVEAFLAALHRREASENQYFRARSDDRTERVSQSFRNILHGFTGSGSVSDVSDPRASAITFAVKSS